MKKTLYFFVTLFLLILFFNCQESGSSSGGGGGSGGGDDDDDDGVVTPKVYEFSADTNTLALWHFNEMLLTQTLADSSTNDRDLVKGSDTNVETIDPTQVNSGHTGFGYCLSFNGSDLEYAYRSTGHNMSGDDNFTIEMWIKTTQNSETVLFKGDSTDVDLWIKNGDIIFRLYEGSWNTVTTALVNKVNDDSWHYIAATYNGTSMKIYIDGVERISADHVVNIANVIRYHLGGRPSNTFYDGYIDEVRLSDKARSASEISNYYNSAK